MKKIDEMTIAEAKEYKGKLESDLKELRVLFNEPIEHNSEEITISNSSSHIEVGKQYLFRSVTMINLGKVVSIKGSEIKLEKSSWISDTGRFGECLKNGVETIENSELEIYPNGSYVNKGGIIDWFDYPHNLPTITK